MRVAEHFPWLLIGCLGLVSCQGNFGTMAEDVLDGAISAGRSLKGHVAQAGSRKYFRRFQYDLVGRPVSVVHVVEGTAHSYSYVFGYVGGALQGSELGNVATRTTLPDGEQVLSQFDAMGTPQEVSSQMPSGVPRNARPSRSLYNDRILGRTKLNRFGQVEWTEAGDTTRTLRIYDAFRRPLQVLTQKLATGEILQAFGYRYDKVGRVTQVRDYCAQPGGGTLCCDPRESSCTEGPLSATYEYDVAGGLKKMTSPQGGQVFEADAIGNLVSKSNALQKYGENGLPHALTSVVNGQGHQVGSYTYNRVGSMVSMEEDGVSTNFIWNANNMPTRTEKNGNVTERFYLGESLYKRVDTFEGKTTTTLFLPGLRIEDGTYRKFYGTAAERESQGSATRGTLRFYHGDHLGSSTLVTDEQGNPVSRTAYIPFGENRFSEGSFTPKKQFTSKEKEEVSGLYDYSARLYNARTGRFISADSLMDGLNRYSYVRNNPINLVDPSGHVAEKKKKDTPRVTRVEDLVYNPEDGTYYLPGELNRNQAKDENSKHRIQISIDPGVIHAHWPNRDGIVQSVVRLEENLNKQIPPYFLKRIYENNGKKPLRMHYTTAEATHKLCGSDRAVGCYDPRLKYRFYDARNRYPENEEIVNAIILGDSARVATPLHEVGHALDHALGDVSEQQQFRSAVALAYNRAKGYPDNYAQPPPFSGDDYSQIYAESFSWYFNDKAGIKVDALPKPLKDYWRRWDQLATDLAGAHCSR